MSVLPTPSPRPRRFLVALVACVAFVALVACGGPSAPGPGAGDPKAPGAGSAGAAAASGSAEAAPVERPFAASAAEATELIGVILEKRGAAMSKCIGEYRARKKLPHERVEVSVGIDQNGTLIGATLKKGKDEILATCMQNALGNALFPRSHAGIITMTKSYEDVVQ